MRATTGKYDAFCKVFVQLSSESQDKLVETARRLLKAHQFTRYGTAQQKKLMRKTKTV
jgi:hypothetical protein